MSANRHTTKTIHATIAAVSIGIGIVVSVVISVITIIVSIITIVVTTTSSRARLVIHAVFLSQVIPALGAVVVDEIAMRRAKTCTALEHVVATESVIEAAVIGSLVVIHTVLIGQVVSCIGAHDIAVGVVRSTASHQRWVVAHCRTLHIIVAIVIIIVVSVVIVIVVRVASITAVSVIVGHSIATTVVVIVAAHRPIIVDIIAHIIAKHRATITHHSVVVSVSRRTAVVIAVIVTRRAHREGVLSVIPPTMNHLTVWATIKVIVMLLHPVGWASVRIVHGASKSFKLRAAVDHTTASSGNLCRSRRHHHRRLYILKGITSKRKDREKNKSKLHSGRCQLAAAEEQIFSEKDPSAASGSTCSMNEGGQMAGQRQSLFSARKVRTSSHEFGAIVSLSAQPPYRKDTLFTLHTQVKSFFFFHTDSSTQKVRVPGT